MRAIVSIVLLAIVLVTVPTSASPPPKYTVRIIDNEPGLPSWASGINDWGQVVGTRYMSSNYEAAFFWENGDIVNIVKSSAPAAINNTGHVCGSYEPWYGGASVFLWHNGSLQDLGPMGGYRAGPSGMNESGQIVGEVSTLAGGHYAFTWQNGGYGALGDVYSAALGVNDHGDVVGWGGPDWSAVVWGSDGTTSLGTWNGKATYGKAINNNDQVVGYTWSDQARAAFLWQNGTYTALPNLMPWMISEANAINDTGDVVGWSGGDARNTHAVLWHDGTAYDLNALIPPESDVELEGAMDINSSGQIVGYGVSNGAQRAFIATPVVYDPAGDANGDGVVDLQDFGILKDNFGITTGVTWAMGDFNADGCVDLQDFGILKEHFGESWIAVIPEPATLSLLALGELAVLKRSRKRNS